MKGAFGMSGQVGGLGEAKGARSAESAESRKSKDRPEPWGDPREGFHYDAVEQDDWSTPSVGAGRCRFTVGPGRLTCKKPAVATLWRATWGGRLGHRRVPWDYCGEHMYGRWIEDGKVMGWRLVRDDGA